jgi:CRP-like cAMP-binding protein
MVYYNSHDYIMKECEEGDFMLILVTGSLLVCTFTTKHLREKDLVSLAKENQAIPQLFDRSYFEIHRSITQPGSFVGEVAALGVVSRRSATVVAAEPVTAVLLERDDMWLALKAFPGETELFTKQALNHLKQLLEGSECRVPEFQSFDSAEQAQMHASLIPRYFAPGEVICQEGAEGSSFFAVHQGHLEVWKDDVRVGELKDGERFGLRGLIHEGPGEYKRGATVISKTFSRLLELSRHDFRSIVKNSSHQAHREIRETLLKEDTMMLQAKSFLRTELKCDFF